MGWDTSFPTPSISAPSDSEILARFDLPRRPYVLHVGSIEPRKNLPKLVDAFCRLRHDHKSAAPLCILVGQNGWKVQEVRKQVRNANRNGEVVRWIGDADDRELAAFYRGAEFTVVPSHTEGWGLSVQESLAHGTPCIASRAGGLPEVGADLAQYVDPDSSDDLYRAIADWVFNPEAVASARKKIRHRMGAQVCLATWDLAADRVLEACADEPNGRNVAGASRLVEAAAQRSRPSQEGT
ncbi:MAG: glycosyltransferase [Hyphomicrobiaceae bacterium]